MNDVNTRAAIIVEARNQIARLEELIKTAADGSCDLTDISFEIDKVTRSEGAIRDILNRCEDY